MRSVFAKRLLAWNFAATILTSAFLLFEVQPIISKYILPWFGGSPAVWSTCLVFFQCVLFGGYAYAHLLGRIPNLKIQIAIHLSLVLFALLLLPITPAIAWKPIAGEPPTWHILCLLGVSVGLPYFVLSTTGPLVQTWFSRTFTERSPYRLYALSNVGSLVALICYPLVVEPALDLNAQTGWWSVIFGLFVALNVVSAVTVACVAKPLQRIEHSDQTVHQLPTPTVRLLWLGLPAMASLMLLATTNHVCQDVAAIPLLWVLPLGLYLMSFIIAFDADRWYWRRTYAAVALALLITAAGMDQLTTVGSVVGFSFVQELLLYNAALFTLCMVCHGELAQLKPHPRHLTSYYLTISLGGALGGMFVSLLAPIIFTTFFEWKLSLVGGGAVAAFVLLASQRTVSPHQPRYVKIAAVILLVAFTGINCVPNLQPTIGGGAMTVTTRSFYGTANVLERFVTDPLRHQFQLISGRIVHGLQFTETQKQQQPTAYYGTTSGVGRLLARQNSHAIRVGAIGLGAGTIAAYCQKGQSIRFYELNPDMQRLAERYFTFLRDCRGQYEIVLGDGRLSLEREQLHQFDLFVVDAFSGDAIPTHLLTREAMDIYLKHLKSTGELAFNISNRYVNLVPVVEQLAKYGGFTPLHLSSPENAERGEFAADWMILSRNADTIAALQPFAQPDAAVDPSFKIWTDHYSNLFQILK